MQSSDGVEFTIPQVPMDTLTMAKVLESYGTPQRQAEGLAMVLSGLNANHVATKVDVGGLRKDTKVETDNIRRDIEELRKETKMAIANCEANLRTELANIESRLKVEIANIKADIFKWIVPLLVGQLAAFAGILKIFIH